jgi:serine protease
VDFFYLYQEEGMRISIKLGALFLVLLALGLIGQVQAPAQGPEQVRVLVEFQPGAKGQVQQALQNSGAVFHYEFDELNTFAVSLPQAALAGIERNPNVVFIEEDALRFRMGEPSGSPQPWTTTSTMQITPYGIDSVQAPDLWAQGVTGSGRLVCVIDSGLYTAHEDFQGVSVTGGYPNPGWNTDGCGHGTHVAGTIAAADNALGVVGVTPGDASLFIVKVFGDNCSWSYVSDLVHAANQCEQAQANIINMSLGGSFKSRTEEQTFNRLYNNGILSIAAAGNDGSTRLSYPASYSSVVSVAAIDSSNVAADFSQRNSQVELAAPGVSVLSSVPWLSDNSVTVDGVRYEAGHIENAKLGSASGALANGGLCTAANSAWSGKVVLCERGEISFFDKVRNVQNSGGVAAVIYNNVPGDFAGTLGDGNTSTIPAVSLSQADGQYLVANKLGQTAAVASTLTKPASGYESWNGTSMATPHVAGAAALIWSANPDWSNAQIREAMNATALDLGAAGRDNTYGYGLVQAFAAWQYLGGSPPPPPPPPPPSGSLSVSVSTDKASYANRETVSITVNVSDGTNPVGGASVAVTISSPLGKTVSLSGTTNASGTAVVTWKVNSKNHGVGEYQVRADASKSGFDPGSGTTAFTVTN